MRFVLFRHAHKGIFPFDDPELSPQGHEQASLLPEMIQQQRLIKPTHLYVSPRKRASQTFIQISKKFNLKLEIQPDLDQRNQNESSSDFKKRILNFMKHVESLNNTSTVIFACTHYDWIEESMTLINSDKDLNSFEFSHWSPTQHIIFELQDGVWKFIHKGIAK